MTPFSAVFFQIACRSFMAPRRFFLFPGLCWGRFCEEYAPLQVVDKIFEADVRFGADDADAAYELAAHRKLSAEDMFDAGADC